MAKVKKILVVCTGNSCRSPMAEGFLKKYLKAEEDFEIISAGIIAPSGFLPTKEAVWTMKEEAIDISPYRTTAFTDELAKYADIILVMEEKHKSYILEKIPEAKEKVYLYKEFAGMDEPNKEIYDPIGKPLSFYREVKEELKNATIKIVDRIKEGQRE